MSWISGAFIFFLVIYIAFIQPEKIEKKLKKDIRREEINAKWKYVMEVDTAKNKNVTLINRCNQILYSNSREKVFDFSSDAYFPIVGPVYEIRIYEHCKLIETFEKKDLPMDWYDF